MRALRGVTRKPAGAGNVAAAAVSGPARATATLLNQLTRNWGFGRRHQRDAGQEVARVRPALIHGANEHAVRPHELVVLRHGVHVEAARNEHSQVGERRLG